LHRPDGGLPRHWSWSLLFIKLEGIRRCEAAEILFVPSWATLRRELVRQEKISNAHREHRSNESGQRPVNMRKQRSIAGRS
jgi:hypothetical protein